MATDEQWNALPGVEEQDELPEPIKIRWDGDARHRVRTGLHAALESDWTGRALAIRCFDRQKTNVVVRTREERDALLAELDTLDSPAEWGERVGYSANGLNAIRRVKRELRPGEDSEDTGVTCGCGATAAGGGGPPVTCPQCGDVLGGGD